MLSWTQPRSRQSMQVATELTVGSSIGAGVMRMFCHSVLVRERGGSGRLGQAQVDVAKGAPSGYHFLGNDYRRDVVQTIFRINRSRNGDKSLAV